VVSSSIRTVTVGSGFSPDLLTSPDFGERSRARLRKTYRRWGIAPRPEGHCASDTPDVGDATPDVAAGERGIVIAKNRPGPLGTASIARLFSLRYSEESGHFVEGPFFSWQGWMETRTIPESTPLEELARSAMGGDRGALGALLRALQDGIYGLALRMSCNPGDAEDAAQEILLRIATRLSQFDFRSKVKTWAYRVAVNYILDAKKSALERQHMGFARMADDLAEGLELAAPSETEESLLIEEVKIGCSLGMLQCLDRPERLAYVLGEILELPGPEAAEALDISPELFRKRLQQARAAIVEFMRRYCGLVSDDAPCRCNRQLPKSLREGTLSPDSCRFAKRKSSFAQEREMVRRVDEARWAFQVHKIRSPEASPIDFAGRLLDALGAR